MTIIIKGAQDATSTVIHGGSMSNAARLPGGRVPPSLSRDEIGYWTMKWRAGDEESARARAAGESVVFNSADPNDIVRWLLSPDG
jgi:hypothetical protein